MNPLVPLIFIFKSFNTVSNVYMASQMGWWCYKKFREYRRSDDIKARFKEEFKAEFGCDPPTDLIEVALKAHKKYKQKGRD